MLHGFEHCFNSSHIFERMNIRTGFVLDTMEAHNDKYYPCLLMPNFSYFQSCIRPEVLEKVVHIIAQKKSKYVHSVVARISKCSLL